MISWTKNVIQSKIWHACFTWNWNKIVTVVTVLVDFNVFVFLAYRGKRNLLGNECGKKGAQADRQAGTHMHTHTEAQPLRTNTEHTVQVCTINIKTNSQSVSPRQLLSQRKRKAVLSSSSSRSSAVCAFSSLVSLCILHYWCTFLSMCVNILSFIVD